MAEASSWIKPTIWGAIGGAVAITVIGFSADWVMTSGAANELAETEADNAVLAALTPVCVERFNALNASVRQDHLTAMEEQDSWERGEIVEDQGWADITEGEEPVSGLAEACAEEILASAEVPQAS